MEKRKQKLRWGSSNASDEYADKKLGSRKSSMRSVHSKEYLEKLGPAKAKFLPPRTSQGTRHPRGSTLKPKPSTDCPMYSSMNITSGFIKDKERGKKFRQTLSKNFLN
jgi:hypothetical protein